MTDAWDRITATGSGQVNFRLQIEGFPFEPVTSRAMEGTATDGRIRYAGLAADRIELEERVDIVRAKWEPKGFRVTLVDRKARWTEAFKIPTAVTYLDANLVIGATPATVKATGAFAAAGQIYCDTETMKYTSLTATTFEGLTRGFWESLDQTHFVLDGERARRPEVTNWPRVREGRRVRLYVYASGDNLASTLPTAGTKIWTGVVSTEPQYDGTQWSFSLDPISRKWDADVGGDLEDPATIRGIYYPAQSPLFFSIEETDDPRRGGYGLAATNFRMAGFWETQEDFLADLNTQLSRTSGQLFTPLAGTFTQDVIAVPAGQSWALQYQTDATTPVWMDFVVLSATDLINTREQEVREAGGFLADVVVADTLYEATQTSANLGLVPRATLGGARFASVPLSDSPRFIGGDASTFPANRIYIGGAVGVTASTNTVSVEWESNGVPSGAAQDEAFVSGVAALDTTNRFVTLERVRRLRAPASEGRHYSAVGSDVVEIRMGRDYGFGHLGDFIDALTAETAAQLNSGAVPDIRSTDFVAMADTDIPAAASVGPLVSNRQYSVFAPVSFADVVEQGCRLLGVFPAYNSDGEVTFLRQRLPGGQQAISATLTEANIITGEGEWLGFEIAPLGQFNTIELSTGYDPIEEEYLGPLQRVRDLEAFGRNPDGRTLTIEPKSIDQPDSFSYQDIVLQLGRILGVFGGSYSFLTVRVKFSLFNLLVGDIVKITWNKVPNSDGTLGVINKAAFVVGREWDFASASGKLTLMVTDQNIAGYVPSTKLTITDGSSGTTGPFTATADDTYFPGTTTASDHWDAGDNVRLFRYNDVSVATNEAATIDSEPVGDVLIFTTDDPWVHAGSTWVLGSRVSTSITASGQKAYCYVANADTTLDFSGDIGNNAQTLAP